MKLRNKKTGEIYEIPKMRHQTVQEDDISFFVYKDNEGHLSSYKSLAELNADWEDYTSAEPLIKDEKVRKAVRAWAEATRIKYCTYDGFWEAFRFSNCTICFKDEYEFDELDEEKRYTIDELCGEGEE